MATVTNILNSLSRRRQGWPSLNFRQGFRTAVRRKRKGGASAAPPPVNPDPWLRGHAPEPVPAAAAAAAEPGTLQSRGSPNRRRKSASPEPQAAAAAEPAAPHRAQQPCGPGPDRRERRYGSSDQRTDDPPKPG